MLIGKQIVEVIGYNSELRFVVLIFIYFFVNWAFTFIWPKVVSIELKGNTE